MASIVNQLKKELASLQADITRLQRQAEGLSLTISYLEEKEGIATPRTAVAVTPGTGLQASKAPADKRTRKEPSGEPSPLVQQIVNLIASKGKPMHYREIYEALLRDGTTVSGKDPVRNVSAHISLHKRFFKPMGGGYWALAESDDTDEDIIKDVQEALSVETGGVSE